MRFVDPLVFIGPTKATVMRKSSNFECITATDSPSTVIHCALRHALTGWENFPIAAINAALRASYVNTKVQTLSSFTSSAARAWRLCCMVEDMLFIADMLSVHLFFALFLFRTSQNVHGWLMSFSAHTRSDHVTSFHICKPIQKIKSFLFTCLWARGRKPNYTQNCF